MPGIEETSPGVWKYLALERQEFKSTEQKPRVSIVGKTFRQKDFIKNTLQGRWDPDKKLWHVEKPVSKTDVDFFSNWLRDNGLKSEDY